MVILVRVASLERAYVSSSSFWFSCVHSGATMCRRFHSVTRGVTCALMKSPGSPLFTRAGGWVNSGSSGFTQARLAVVVLIGVRVGSLRRI